MTGYVLKIMVMSIDGDMCEYSNCSTVTTENKQTAEEAFDFFVGHYQKFCNDNEQAVAKMTLWEVTPSGSKGLREFNITKG